MNLFRSEEHICNCKCYVEGTEEGITPLADMLKLFSGPYFTRRMDQDYLVHMRAYAKEMIPTMKALGKTGPFWKRKK